jgi:hypothetical protein
MMPEFGLALFLILVLLVLLPKEKKVRGIIICETSDDLPNPPEDEGDA